MMMFLRVLGWFFLWNHLNCGGSAVLISVWRDDGGRGLLLNLGWMSTDAKLMLADYLLNGFGWGNLPVTLVGSRKKNGTYGGHFSSGLYTPLGRRVSYF